MRIGMPAVRADVHLLQLHRLDFDLSQTDGFSDVIGLTVSVTWLTNLSVVEFIVS